MSLWKWFDKNSTTCQTSPSQLQKTTLITLILIDFNFNSYASLSLFQFIKTEHINHQTTLHKNNVSNPRCFFSFKNSHTFQNATTNDIQVPELRGLVIHHGEPYRDPQENLWRQFKKREKKCCWNQEGGKVPHGNNQMRKNNWSHAFG